MGLKDKVLRLEKNEKLKVDLSGLESKRSEHPNESRPQNTFSEMCECEHPNIPGYATGYGASICTTCGGKVYLDG
jgi:hypothetical protein